MFSMKSLGARISSVVAALTTLVAAHAHAGDESPFDITLTGKGITPLEIAQQAYLKASNTGGHVFFGDQFGASVAVSGDTVVIGAPNEQSGSNVRVLWPLPSVGFVLEEVDALNASLMTGWTQVPFPYQTNATQISITVPVPNRNRFYRLAKAVTRFLLKGGGGVVSGSYLRCDPHPIPPHNP